ncbi:MinD/ParA family protein, partial [Streptomyces sp. SID625]|nr:MinD/ParA family protein [Streptomyces sp. SID625]
MRFSAISVKRDIEEQGASSHDGSTEVGDAPENESAHISADASPGTPEDVPGGASGTADPDDAASAEPDAVDETGASENVGTADVNGADDADGTEQAEDSEASGPRADASDAPEAPEAPGAP